MPDRVLSPRELNRALLARQMLLERARSPLPLVVERMGEVQAQYAPSMYVGLWGRVESFERADLDRALEARRVVQGTLMRSTIHLTSRRDYFAIAAAIRRARREAWLRVSRIGDDVPVRRVAERVRSLLAEGPRTRAELVAAIGADAHLWNGVGLWVDLVRVPPSGTWARRRADLFATAEWWLGSAPDVSEAEGVRLLLARYLRAFGPASIADVSSWSGVPPAAFGPIAAEMRLRRFRDERGGELVDVRRAPLPPAETAAPVRLLPTWDAVLLTHARRTQILPEVWRERVFNTRTPHSVPTFLVDGRVAGSWRFDGRRMTVEPFERLSRRVRRELDGELARLVELHG